MRVLVTGGAGYVGSHVVVALAEAGHTPVVADSFVNSSRDRVARLAEVVRSPIEFHDIDLTSEELTAGLFREGSFEAVVHCAGHKAVGESHQEPLSYYNNNLGSTLSVVAAMREYGVKRLVFSSSATVYGDQHQPPFSEDMSPLASTNPYGWTKVMIERILTDIAAADTDWKIALLRYFNPAGAHESGLIGEEPRGIPNNLMPFIAQVGTRERDELIVHGDDYDTLDGTAERDFIHVVDLAAGHLAALDHLDQMISSVRAFNLGTGHSTSVLSLIRAFERASGRTIRFSIGPRRVGDLAIAFADPSRAQRELKWVAERSVDQMCEDAWRWHLAASNATHSVRNVEMLEAAEATVKEAACRSCPYET